MKDSPPAPKRSLHTGESWQDQWDRVQRWFQRLTALEEKHLVDGNVDMTYAFLPEYAVEEVDIAYAFFMNAYSAKLASAFHNQMATPVHGFWPPVMGGASQRW